MKRCTFYEDTTLKQQKTFHSVILCTCGAELDKKTVVSNLSSHKQNI
jgi:hypothetical protein